MGTLTETDPTAREFVTEILDKALLWNILKVVIQFLHTKNVQQVRAEFGFVLDRHIKGKPQAQNQIVQLSDLESFIKSGLDEGKINWGRSDFIFRPVGADIAFMLCNDADLHFASADVSLLLELGRKISSIGIKVYDSGRLI
jgi:hypothetical protein